MQNVTSIEEKLDATNSFEDICSSIKHGHCQCCHMTSLNIRVNKEGLCVGKCSLLKNINYYLEKRALPVWYNDEGKPVFTVPSYLQDLTAVEKLLIQRISPFVPLHHIKKGVFGISGHVCAFEQDIEGFVNRLPRQKDDAIFIRVLKKMKSEVCGSEETITKAYRVRKLHVLRALQFLKKYNPEYKNITIDMSALDWMKGDEGIIDAKVLYCDNIITAIDNDPNVDDVGPNLNCSTEATVLEFGYVDAGGKAKVSSRDKEIQDAINESIAKSKNKKDIVVDWPCISDKAVSEFGDTRIFVNAFPWLFPGGIGDAKDWPNKNLNQWGKQLLYYEDGRFASDKIFAFFALNYIIRNRNSSSGNWFIDKFQQNCPETLEELQDAIEGGDTSFVNSLTYYSQRIQGSSSYWFKKKMELYSWINYHVQAGNGPPTFFITLSCAEKLWVDVIRLIKERMILAGLDASQCFLGSEKLSQYVNQYSIVIQEFFQKRVLAWLDTVGRNVFKIKHYWVRYEFAPGRGQIHAHLLAIPDNHQIYELCYADYQLPNGAMRRANRLSQWAQENLGLTASVPDPEYFDNIEVDNSNSPCGIRFKDVKESERELDLQYLMKHVQEHQCSGFCMRDNKGETKDKRRVCKTGCGREHHMGKCDTPGFPLNESPEIKYDHRRSQKLYMPRNHPRINQTSSVLLQSWRGNCDVQILVYNSDPMDPDIAEIAKVTDYVVSYSCKGNTTLKEERQHTSKLIMA